MYLTKTKSLESFSSDVTTLDPAVSPSSGRQVKVQEDEVDKLLATRDGRVLRKKDPQMLVLV